MAASSAFVTTLAGVAMPRMIYGTAWKKDRTTDLVVQAVRAGFRGIDTACQPKHYSEGLVGAALQQLYSTDGLTRSALFLQTKFTSPDGQDMSTIPYDSTAPLPAQVQQSLGVSLKNLHTDYLDSLVLHSPMHTHAKTMEVWRVFEQFVADGKVKQLGISNVSSEELEALWAEAIVKPAVVQNRFYRRTGFDRKLRAFCSANGIIYQSFWTLTANPEALNSPAVAGLAKKYKVTPAQVLFRYLTQRGVAPLTGTTSLTHMQQDLAVLTMPELENYELLAMDRLLS
eukprot:RCo012712